MEPITRNVDQSMAARLEMLGDREWLKDMIKSSTTSKKGLITRITAIVLWGLLSAYLRAYNRKMDEQDNLQHPFKDSDTQVLMP